MWKSYVYILTNFNNTVLYIGVTSNLSKRIAEHQRKVVMGFSAKYNLNKLVYYEEYDSITEAIAREKQLKNWQTKWKLELITTVNSSFEDLSESIP